MNKYQTITRTKITSQVMMAIVVIVGAIGFTYMSYNLLTMNSGVVINIPTGQTRNQKSMIEKQTNQLLNTLATKNTTDQKAVKQLKQIASQRRWALLQIIATNPQIVIDNAIPTSVQKRFPSDIQALLETETTIEGTLEVIYIDFIKQNRAEEVYTIRDKKTGTQIRLYFAGSQDQNLTTDSVIRVNGIKLDDAMAVNTSSNNIQIVSDAASFAPPSIVKKVAVILFNFQNDVRRPYTPDNVRDIVFTNEKSTNSYYKEVSFGQWGLTGKLNQNGDVYGWYTIPYNYNTNCDYYKWAIAAENAVVSKGGDLSGYTNKLFIFPSAPLCQWSGVADLGGISARAWVKSETGLPSGALITHELGHNFSMHHSSSIRCYDADGQPVAISDTCTAYEYGDAFDVMGMPGSIRHINNYHKGQTGTTAPNWLTTANTQTVESSGIYTLAPIELFSNGVQSLRIPRTYDFDGAATEYYYLEFRQPSGLFDNFSPTDSVVNGILIRTGVLYNKIKQTKLIDTTPETPNFFDSTLAIGKTFTDDAHNIAVKLLNITNGQAVVEVTLSGDPCLRIPPGFIIKPNNQNGGIGTSFNYNLTLKNNDPTACPPLSYTITPIFREGKDWTQVPNLMTGTLLPSSSFTQIISVVPPMTTLPGTYSFTEEAALTRNNATSQISATALLTILEILGDVNYDGHITLEDARLVMAHILGSITLDLDAQRRADVNRDGSITSDDALCITNKFFGVTSCLDNSVTDGN